MPQILSSIACNLDADILTAALPLFEESRVGAIEWSFDTLYGNSQIPPWFLELLKAYSNENKLIGHGVFFSLFSGKWSQNQHEWLNQLRQLSSEFHFDHITEHFGFMTGQNFHYGAPLPIPYSKTTLAIGQDRLARIYEASQCPVGLENLAFSYSLDEVKQHGEFLEQLVAPVNGFLILDLHNLYCQIHNFTISYEDIINLYPLDRVREIHISGGTWQDSTVEPERKIRRDTHDEAVPEEVFQLLKRTIDKCPNLKYVVLEQLGNALKTEASKKLFYSDFLKLEEIVRNKNHSLASHFTNSFLPSKSVTTGSILEDEKLYQQQIQLSSILEKASSYQAAIHLLNSSPLAHSDWKIEQWEPHMLETAISIAQKWKKNLD
ncbi:multinuclear nonheme iron-dependent oxidase [Adhaeribacter radiodurans]|uniref:DUF692 family protein n=1 Tax=Adhaeribacter radiodurans TaxID=2745197 RepID=A0A7L7LD47_9BACT|nr:DUF692 family multinuclear iron-containing protein [Adhaeribacter radiodurans]QMU30319.1 DUF692 family protein [Adhaeribacter radiodurans]